MLRKLLFIFTLYFLSSCGEKQYKDPHVLINTSAGDIELELYPDKAPATVKAFLSFVDSGFYNDGSFYRVLFYEGPTPATNTGILQGGRYNTDTSLRPVPAIPHEGTKLTGLSHTNGTVSLARLGPGTAGTEFFICLGDQLQFDEGMASGTDQAGYAAFGKVFRGMDVVGKIHAGRYTGDRLLEKVIIYKMEKR